MGTVRYALVNSELDQLPDHFGGRRIIHHCHDAARGISGAKIGRRYAASAAWPGCRRYRDPVTTFSADQRYTVALLILSRDRVPRGACTTAKQNGKSTAHSIQRATWRVDLQQLKLPSRLQAVTFASSAKCAFCVLLTTVTSPNMMKGSLIR